MAIAENNLHTVVATAIEESFDDIGFMEVDPLPDGVPPVAGASMHTVIPVTVPYKRMITLTMPRALVKEITSLIFDNEEVSINQKLLDDTILELSNTIAGRIMNQLNPNNELFALGLPQVSEGTSNLPGQMLVEHRFVIDEQPCNVRIYAE